MAEETQAVAVEPQQSTPEETAKAQEAAEATRPRDRGADGKFKSLLSTFTSGAKDSLGNEAEPDEPPPNFREEPEEEVDPEPEMKPVKVKPPAAPAKKVKEPEPVAEEPEEEAEDEPDHDDDEQPRPKLTPAQEAALKAFAKRFDLPEGLDQTTEARDHALERFNRLTEESAQPAQPVGPAAGQNGQQRPQQVAQQPPPPTPAPGLPTFDDKAITELVDTFGPEIQPLANVVKALQQQLTDSRQQFDGYVRQQETQSFGRMVNGFFAEKVRAGFSQQLGSLKSGLTNEQKQIRHSIIEKAARYQLAEAQAGRTIDDDEALELSFQASFRDEVTKRAREQGQKDVQNKVISRHSQLSLAPRGTGRGPSSNGQQQLMGSLRSFVRKR